MTRTVTLFLIFMVCFGFCANAQKYSQAELMDPAFKPKAFSVERPEVSKPTAAPSMRLKITEDWFEPDTMCLYTTTEKFREIYTYTPTGFLGVYFYQTWYSGGWVNAQQETFLYDGKDNLLSDTWQRWVTDHWQNNSRTVYTYDANNNMLSATKQTWGESDWDNVSRIAYTYDGNNNMLTKLEQVAEGLDWANSKNTIYTYDERKNMLTSLEQAWDGAWANTIQETYTYSAQNWVLSRTHEDFNNPGKGTFRLVYTLDGSGNVLNRTYEGWDGQNWYLSEQYTCTYDANNNLLTQLIQVMARGSWKNYALLTYEYDAHSNMLMELIQMWDGDNSAWVDDEKYTFQYDENDNIINVVYYPYRNYPYENNMMYTHTWDGHNMLTNLIQYRNIADPDWSNLLLFKYTYDQYKNCTKAEHFAWLGAWEYDRAHDLSVTYNNAQSTFEIGGGFYMVELSYVKVVKTGVENPTVSDNSILVYPNPTSGMLTITSTDNKPIKQISIYNQTGQKVMQGSCPSGNVDLSHLTQGMYLIQITTEKGVATKKIIRK